MSSTSTSFSSSIPYYSLILEPSTNPNTLQFESKSNCKRLRLRSANKYKGVVPQPNGRWGVQLYEASKRVWVGTFDTQELAARAYDTAVVRFRGPHAATNFPIPYSNSGLQLDFLASHSKARVIDMLRAHTYRDELARFMRARIAINHKKRASQEDYVDEHMVMDTGCRERLFEKVVTPSDVGKLHRLVIPKQYAKRYLPRITTKDNVGGIMLSFEDERREKMWRFKYCYWLSSQNYVLTKGWGEFVKDRGLKSGDIVSFYASVASNTKRFYIDSSSRPPSVLEKICNSRAADVGNDGSSDGDGDGDGGGGGEDGLVSYKMLRLFGVDMSVKHLHHKNVL